MLVRMFKRYYHRQSQSNRKCKHNNEYNKSYLSHLFCCLLNSNIETDKCVRCGKQQIVYHIHEGRTLLT